MSQTSKANDASKQVCMLSDDNSYLDAIKENVDLAMSSGVVDTTAINCVEMTDLKPITKRQQQTFSPKTKRARFRKSMKEQDFKELSRPTINLDLAPVPEVVKDGLT